MEFLFALFIFPLLSFSFGIIGQILIKKIYSCWDNTFGMVNCQFYFI